jgi:hypothetical protein
LLPKLHPRWDFSTLNDIPQTSQDDAGCEIQLRMWWKYLGVFFSIRIYSSNGVRIQAATIPSTIRHRWWGRLVRLPSFARPTGIRLQNDYSPRKEKNIYQIGKKWNQIPVSKFCYLVSWEVQVYGTHIMVQYYRLPALSEYVGTWTAWLINPFALLLIVRFSFLDAYIHTYIYICGGFHKRENPIKMHDLGYPPISGNLHIYK